MLGQRLRKAIRTAIEALMCSVGRHRWVDRHITFGERRAMVVICDRPDCYAMQMIGYVPPMPAPPGPPKAA